MRTSKASRKIIDYLTEHQEAIARQIVTLLYGENAHRTYLSSARARLRRMVEAGTIRKEIRDGNDWYTLAAVPDYDALTKQIEWLFTPAGQQYLLHFIPGKAAKPLTISNLNVILSDGWGLYYFDDSNTALYRVLGRMVDEGKLITGSERQDGRYGRWCMVTNWRPAHFNPSQADIEAAERESVRRSNEILDKLFQMG